VPAIAALLSCFSHVIAAMACTPAACVYDYSTASVGRVERSAQPAVGSDGAMAGHTSPYACWPRPMSTRPLRYPEAVIAALPIPSRYGISASLILLASRRFARAVCRRGPAQQKVRLSANLLDPIISTAYRVSEVMVETHPEKRLIGYARVSTYGQTLDSQLDQLRAAGCSSRNIYREKVTGARGPTGASLTECSASWPPVTW
jgi:Resolvase, N terminal domain